MLTMYIIATLLSFVYLILWITSKKIHIWEALGGCAITFIIAGVVHCVSEGAMTHDTETWAGRVTSARYVPHWVSEESREEPVYNSKGERTGTKTVYYEEDHSEYWDMETTLGGEYISESVYNYLRSKFGKVKIVDGYRPNYERGDRNDYVLVNVNKWFEPTADVRSFENRIKNTDTLFNHITLTDADKTRLFQYPNVSTLGTRRILGPSKISRLLWNRMCSTIGPVKGANVLLLNFTGSDKQEAMKQEAYWRGGRKNELILCKGKGWVYVFGWCEDAIVKKNLETILMDNELTNAIIPLIQREIMVNFKRFDWHKFDYIEVQPPAWAYVLHVFLSLMIGGFYLYAMYTNDMDDNINIMN